MKFLKKSQIIVFVIALMLIAAGYLNYTTGDAQNMIKTNAQLTDTEKYGAIGDAKLVSGNVEETNQIEENIENELNEVLSNNTIVENNIIETNTNIEKDDYFTTTKLERDTMYSQMLESYNKILDNSSISVDQKQIAQNEVKNINDTKNAIMITENLIKTKGFSDVVILKNGDSVNIIVQDEELEKDEIAQIQNIGAREMKAEIGNIHVSRK